MITVFNRLPSTFGADRFLLTNSGEDAALLGQPRTVRTMERRAVHVLRRRDGQHRAGSGRQPRLRSARERPIGRRRSVRDAKRRVARPWTAVQRSRVHDQVERRLPPARRHPDRGDRALSGRPAVLADAGVRKSRAGRRSRCGRSPPAIRGSGSSGRSTPGCRRDSRSAGAGSKRSWMPTICPA